MQTRFKKKAKVFDIGVTAVAAVLSVGIMLFGVFHYGLSNTWPELVLNLFYIACLAMMWMYFFNSPRITTQQFNYWSSVCVGITILLRDVLFAPPLAYYSLHLACSTLSVVLILMLTFFYARKEWKTYSKSNLWMIFVVDCLIALRAAQRIHRLYAHRNMDTAHHHLRAGGLFRYRAGKSINR